MSKRLLKIEKEQVGDRVVIKVSRGEVIPLTREGALDAWTEAVYCAGCDDTIATYAAPHPISPANIVLHHLGDCDTRGLVNF